MKKDAYYFPHFSNARNDRKLRRLRKELGVEGYGIYFMILEILRDQDGFKYPLDDIDLLADDFGTSEQKVRAVITVYKLFEVDNNEMFFSAKFNEFMQPYLNMKEQRRLAGIASGKARKLKALNEHPFNDSSTTDEQSKVNESKVNKSKYKEFISLFNRITNRKFKGDTKAERQFKARIKDGYTMQDFEKAITNCKHDPYHIENTQYLTPEFITRADKLEKFINIAPKTRKAVC